MNRRFSKGRNGLWKINGPTVSQITPILQADWAGGTANNGGLFNITSGTGNEVVATTGLDFPALMTNCLRTTCLLADVGLETVRCSTMDQIVSGEQRYFRLYFRMTLGDDDTPDDNQFHPVQDGNAGSQINWEWSLYNNTHPRTGSAIPAGEYVHTFQMGTGTFGLSRFICPNLQKGVTYRHEWAVFDDGETTFNLHARVYIGDSLTPLYQDSDFTSQDETVSLADNPDIAYNILASTNGINIGWNGIFGTATYPTIAGYYGGLAISRNQGWNGVYGGVSGEPT